MQASPAFRALRTSLVMLASLLRLVLLLVAFLLLLRLMGWTPPGQRQPPGREGREDSGNREGRSGATGGGNRAPRDEELVPCSACGVFVPRASALAREGHWYCTPLHQAQGPQRRRS